MMILILVDNIQISFSTGLLEHLADYNKCNIYLKPILHKERKQRLTKYLRASSTKALIWVFIVT